MDKRTKNTIIIISIIVIAVIIIVLISFFKKSTTNQTSSNISVNVSNDQSSQTKTVTSLNFFISFPLLLKNNLTFVGDKENNHFTKYDLSNNKNNIINNNEVLGIEKITYSPNTNQAIVFSSYPEKNIKLYNFNKNNIITLNNDVLDTTWINDNEFLYSFYENINDPDKFMIQFNVYNINQESFQTIYKKEFESSSVLPVNYINNSLFYTTSATKNSTLTKVDINNKQENIVAQNITNLLACPNQKLLIYNINNNTDQFSIYNLENGENKLYKETINFNKLACINNNTAIATILSEENSFKTMNINSGVITHISISNQTNINEINIDNLISTINNTIFFTVKDQPYLINLDQ